MEISHLRPASPPPALQHHQHHSVYYYYFFYHFKGSGTYEIRSSSDFPGALVCHAEENIKNTKHTPLLSTNNISCLLRAPAPCRCLWEPPPPPPPPREWWWRAGRSSTMTWLLTRRTRTRTSLVSAPWICSAATVSLNSLWAVDGNSSLRAEWVDDLNFLNVVDTDSVAASDSECLDCETLRVTVLMNVPLRVTAQTPGMF